MEETTVRQAVLQAKTRKRVMDADEKAREYFSIFVFKVEPCSQKTKHPWDSCDYCHPQENARRRDVRKFRYLAEACPDYKLHGFCALGNDCPFAHGVFEINLHPSKYRTQMCTEGHRCCRKVCFFAHSEAQLRQPDYRYGYRTAAEAECVKERLLAEVKHPQMLQVRPGGHVASPLQRISPSQVAPGTPPQATPPRLGLAAEGVNNVADAFRTLPSALPTRTSGLVNRSEPTFSHPLFDQQSLGSWVTPSELDIPAAPQRSSLMDVRASGQAQYLRPKASQQTRSLPADGGPRISMKVRRELGLEPPAKARTHSIPAVTYGPPAPSLPASAASLPNTANSMAVRSFLNNTNISPPLPASLPALPSLQGNGLPLGGFSNSLPALSSGYRPLRVTSPLPLGTSSLRMMSPHGMSLSFEEAMAKLGITSPMDGGNDLSFVASVLGILSRLGYSLAPEAGSPLASECVDRDQLSGHSSPVNLLSQIAPLNSFAAQLDLNQTTGNVLSAAASAPGLAGLGLSTGSDNSYNLFN